MSELEKLQRTQYQENRKRNILRRTIRVLILSVVLLISGLTANQLSQNTFVTYTENGNADYQVLLNKNEFYDTNYVDKGHAYVSSLIDEIKADLSYNMKVNARKASYTYSYYMNACVEIWDNHSDAPLYNPVYELVPVTEGTSTDTSFTVTESITIDYQKYNTLAQNFVSAYNLSDTDSNLIITLHVDILSNCPDYTNSEENSYDVELCIPLNKTTMKITTNTTVPESEYKVLACNNGAANFFKVLTIIISIIDALFIALLAHYMIRTRDCHIDYTRKVKKILSSYKSYIQRINTLFDTTGYQELEVDTFPELLEIRDTLQLPILMYENEDQTLCRFLIPTSNQLLYYYIISVDEDTPQK